MRSKGLFNKRRDGANLKSNLLLAGAAVLLLMAGLLMWREVAESNKLAYNGNQLLVGPEAPEGLMTIPTHEAVEFSGVAQDEILGLRSVEVERYQVLMATNYEPFQPIFRRLQDKGAWFSEFGFFYLGQTEGSTKGASALSSSILTPFQLLVPMFWGVSIWTEGNLKWNRKDFKPDVILSKNVPMRPAAGVVLWNAREARGEITYALSDFVTAVGPYLTTPLRFEDVNFGISAYNARDLNLSYVYLNPADSVGVVGVKQRPIALQITNYFDYITDLCGSVAGCNHERNAPAPLDTIKVVSLPASASFKLWREMPSSVDAPPDFTYTIRIE